MSEASTKANRTLFRSRTPPATSRAVFCLRSPASAVVVQARRCGGPQAGDELVAAWAGREGEAAHPHWASPEPKAMLMDEIDAIWSAIAERDD